MGPPDRPSLSISAEQRAVQDQAKADRIASIQDRLSDETRDLLIRFGRNKAFSGANLPGSIGGLNPGGFGGRL